MRAVLSAQEFDEFVATMTPRLVRAGWLLVGDRQLAEDLAQETFVRMHRKWQDLARVEAAPVYAHRTLVRLARRQMRTRAWRARPAADALPDVAVESGERTSLLNAQMRQLLLGLPARQREVLVLRYYADLSVDATAAAMGSSAGTVKSQTSKALSALRQKLRETDADEHAPSPSTAADIEGMKQ